MCSVARIHVVNAIKPWYAYIRVVDLEPFELKMLMHESIFGPTYDADHMIRWLNMCLDERMVGSSSDPMLALADYTVMQTYTVRELPEVLECKDIDDPEMDEIPPEMMYCDLPPMTSLDFSTDFVCSQLGDDFLMDD